MEGDKFAPVVLYRNFNIAFASASEDLPIIVEPDYHFFWSLHVCIEFFFLEYM